MTDIGLVLGFYGGIAILREMSDMFHARDQEQGTRGDRRRVFATRQ